MVFHKESCSVCKHLVPVAEKVSGEFEGKIKFYSLSVSDPEVLARFKEMKLLGVPQTVFIDKGEKKEALPCGAISPLRSGRMRKSALPAILRTIGRAAFTTMK